MPTERQASGIPNTVESQRLYCRAKTLMPGGTQLLSKRPEMYAPGRWPAYYRSARGCEIVDLDGNTFLDMSLMGIGSCLLGYADPAVTAAVVRRVEQGSMCTLNAPDEVELAEQLIDLHTWAEQARFLRTGGEAMAAAVRIARSATCRDAVAVCGYHGWHDWYLAANRTREGSQDALRGHLLGGLSPVGVPTKLAGTTFTFRYNEIDELAAIVKNHGSHLAAVVIEPIRRTEPAKGFLEGIRELSDRAGAVLIADEISAGWRFLNGGAHLRYGLTPDLAVFAKAMSNGHPLAAVIGRSQFMQAAQNTFISSTYWTEAVGPAAGLATLQRFREVDVPAHIHHIGKLLQSGLKVLAEEHEIRISIDGPPALTSISFDHPEAAELMTLFTVGMLRYRILCGSGFYPSLSHSSDHVNQYLAAAEEVFGELKQAIVHSDAKDRIAGLVKHSGFERLA